MGRHSFDTSALCEVCNNLDRIRTEATANSGSELANSSFTVFLSFLPCMYFTRVVTPNVSASAFTQLFWEGDGKPQLVCINRIEFW